MEKMTEKEMQEAIDNLKLERVKSYGVRGEIISQWKLKTSINDRKSTSVIQVHI